MEINLKLTSEQIYLIFGLVRKGKEIIPENINELDNILIQLRSEGTKYGVKFGA